MFSKSILLLPPGRPAMWSLRLCLHRFLHPGLTTTTPSLRRSSTRLPTLTTTVSLLYVKTTKPAGHFLFYFYFIFINLTSLVCTDPQPLSSRSLRRCSRLRDGFRHHLERCPDCLLRKEDWPLTSRQANRPGAVIRKRHLVGSRQQAHEHRGKLRCARSCFCRLFLCRACRGNAVSPEGRMCEPRPQTSMHDSAARTVHNVQCTFFFSRLRCPTFWRSS